MRFLSWIGEKIRWIFILCAVAGPIMVVVGLWGASHIRSALASGIETTATVEGGTRTWRARGGSESYVLTLAWTDTQGARRKVEGVKVTNRFARLVVAGPGLKYDRNFSAQWDSSYRISRESVQIKYLSSSPNSPVILEDAAERQREEEEFTQAGLVISAIGLGGIGLYWLAGRRRRSELA